MQMIHQTLKPFPKDFLWGASTSAYQVHEHIKHQVLAFEKILAPPDVAQNLKVTSKDLVYRILRLACIIVFLLVP